MFFVTTENKILEKNFFQENKFSRKQIVLCCLYKLLQIAWDDAQRLAKRRLEREQGRNDAANDLSELSEGEKEKGDANTSESVKEVPRINSEMQLWSDDNKSRNLYIVLIRYHLLLTNLLVFISPSE